MDRSATIDNSAIAIGALLLFHRVCPFRMAVLS
jgi:hypothetical protein